MRNLPVIVLIVLAALVFSFSLTGRIWSAEPKVRGMLSADAFQDVRVAALAKAACVGDLGGVSQELRRGAGPNSPGFWNDTPLTWAVGCGDRSGVNALLNAGGDPNYKAPDKVLTHEDAERLHFWPPEPRTIEGFSATYSAAERSDPEILSLLLRRGGDPNSFQGNSFYPRRSALGVALEMGLNSGKWENYYLLLNQGADINKADSIGNTVATDAVFRNAYDKVEELLNRGYDYDLPGLGLHVQLYQHWSDPHPQARMRVVELLKQRGVCFPLRRLLERDVKITMQTDGSLLLQWDKPAAGCLPYTYSPSILKRGDVWYDNFLARANGIRPGETRSLAGEDSGK